MPSQKRREITAKLNLITQEGGKPDKRTRDSLKRIRNAYASMLSEGMNPVEISVTDLAARANVDRKTFYNYYGGIYELDKSIAAEIGAAFRRSIEANRASASESGVPNMFFRALVDVLNSDMDFYGLLFKIRESSALSRAIMDSVRSETRRVIAEKYGFKDRKLELSADFVIAGCIEVCRRWYSSDPRPRFDEYIDILSKLCYGGLTAL
ncbi:MAG: TetR/AcrR family transcriptional regulator C-terminal domain-containing protein [Clostridia bacterium]|jgi:AcrR family transcriptional regulator|nr:TetR/AcrR family transcriptional regulator C-terminal domain-containing protein [Clostridia bacterium]